MNNYSPQTHQLGNIDHALTIDLKQAGTGKIESLIVPREDACEMCLGTGQSWRDDDGTCSSCNNTGYVKYEKRFEVRIPAGIDNGHRLRLAGEGNREAAQAERGDLYITIRVSPHKLFGRKGQDLRSFFRLTEEEMKSGAVVTVPTLWDGQKRLRIPPGTSAGAIFRLAGLGLRSLENSERGDLFVTVGNELVRHGTDDTQRASVVTPPSTVQRNVVKEFFLQHAKMIVASVLVFVGVILYFSNRETKPAANTSLPVVVKSPALYVPNSLPSATEPIHLPFSLPNGANIIPPQGPRGDRTIVIINRADGDIALKVVSSSSQQTRRFVYVRSGKRLVIPNLTREVYLLRWETGSDWEVTSHRFLSMRSIRQFDQPFDLRRTNFRVNFTRSIEGTLREVELDESDFDDK